MWWWVGSFGGFDAFFALRPLGRRVLGFDGLFGAHDDSQV